LPAGHLRWLGAISRTGSVYEEEKDGYGRFRLVRREECIGQVEIREKKRLDASQAV
jgi:hypothetical protein